MIHLIGFGGQGKAWAPSLQEAGVQVMVYLPDHSHSVAIAEGAGIKTRPIHLLTEFLKKNDTVVFACPDRKIGEVYQKYISACSEKLHLILIHGFAMWSGDLIPNRNHSGCLLAPKAIGPELREAIQNSQKTKTPHSLKAAVCVSAGDGEVDFPRQNVMTIATQSLAFDSQSLIEASFDQETVGDLISEQLLLCGGVFSLLEWTMKEMRDAQIPEALIHEECITELELIARVLRKKGLPGTLQAISDSAKAGAVMMRKRFIEHKLPELLHLQANEVLDKTFLKNLSNEAEWKSDLSGAFQAKAAPRGNQT